VSIHIKKKNNRPTTTKLAFRKRTLHLS